MVKDVSLAQTPEDSITETEYVPATRLLEKFVPIETPGFAVFSQFADNRFNESGSNNNVELFAVQYSKSPIKLKLGGSRTCTKESIIILHPFISIVTANKEL
jgi:hypothetical protein